MISCGDYLDMTTKEPVQVDSISLPQRVITLFEGDRYAIPVVVKPDSAFTSTSFYWQSANDSVAMFLNDSLWALREGVTQAFVRTATGDHSDTCTVCVLPPLFVEPGLYPYDMVIYASVNVHGTKITRENADQYPVAAYVRNELRGIGQMHEAGGNEYMVIRVWSPYESGEQVTLRCYERPQARCELFPDTLTFDGERHGTLSDLYPLTFDNKAEEWSSVSITK
jgi:hypothetical protein